jgi:hypothetical protein
MKHFREKLDTFESLRIKKIGNNYFAYARWTEYGVQKERYLGRCDPTGKPLSKKHKIRR